ncbi:DUF4954 family protein [Thiospirochaeta perfilievii]|nr:DUF4954 family protein [Thiospirochaeta perfilievii]
MNKINKLPLGGMINEYNTLRIIQSGNKNEKYRNLTNNEIELLEMQKNKCYDWSKILVTDTFEPLQIKHCYFMGTVRIDDMEPISLEFNDVILPVGLYNSQVMSCDIGKNCSIHNVSYLSRVLIGENVMLKDIDELSTSDHAKFGNGIVKDGEDPSGRIELEIANEAGGREILPFSKMLTVDAYLWYKYRDNKNLMESFKLFVETEYPSDRGYYGFIGDRTVIKNSRILKDVTIGSDAYIKGANKLKNLTIKSSPNHKTQIGEGCTLVNGIINEGCKVFYGATAVRFQLMSHSSLKYGARLINSVLGENSTISCCEVLNSFIYPGHEQHHNSSFLIASVLKGQTNIASGATIGSNHNSRANDGELVAGRGFWPGLNCSLKHDSKFATFNIVVKGNYTKEINNPLPFSLISLNKNDKVEVFPGYWFLHNMYALKRNSWKYGVRDQREKNFPRLDFDFLAPDTVSEMLEGREFLEKCAEYSYRKISTDIHTGEDLLNEYDDFGNFTIYSTTIENKNHGVLIHKPAVAYKEYYKMITLYSVDTILKFFKDGGDISQLNGLVNPDKWINCGGQFIPDDRVKSIIDDIVDKKITSWDELHSRYKMVSKLYDRDKAGHAFYVLQKLNKVDRLNWQQWLDAVDTAIKARIEIKERVYSSREKDFNCSFRKITFDSKEEKEAVIGKLDDNSFFKIEEEECASFIEMTKSVDLKKIF